MDPMTYFSTDFKKFGWNLLYWFLSLLCEGPFYLILALVLALAQASGTRFYPWGPLIVWMVSLFSRFISLHVIGSWVLKRILLARAVGVWGFGLAEFLLANLWIMGWMLIKPTFLVQALFEPKGFFPNLLWLFSIPPIALASVLFRFIFGKSFVSRISGPLVPDQSA
jgi:hypothetical protein